jgi:acetylornithine deacetylase/succinyl-diaminopimelate desuccinylase-like protein
MSVDWNAVRDEVTGYLQDLLRLDTTNPPGNEMLCADYIAGVVEREGIESTITESEPGRGNVTARQSGGEAPALMLLGHTDVVAVEPEKWTHPPFSGALINGEIWGRGALDMKDMVAAELMVFLLLKRQGIELNRDVIYAATADEEAGKGNHGVGWLIDHHPEQVDALYVLTEGGGGDSEMGGARFVTIQTGQKGIHRFRLRATGRPGHGSIPHNENAVVRLSQAVAAIGCTTLPIHPSATLKAYLEGIASHQDADTAATLMEILDPEKSEAALSRAPFDGGTTAALGSLLRNTVSPTILDAGSKINVIPGEAVAWLDGRLAPGQTAESFAEEIRPLLGDHVEIEVDQYCPPIEADIDSPLYETIVSVVGEHDPEATVIPALMTGGTDAKHILPRKPETQVLGFMPAKHKDRGDEGPLVHGHNERISVENLLYGTRVLYDVVVRFCEA